ncbi:MAG TPA: hypothetical protein VFA11_09610 [Acidimicrobiales bacterium]|nr:hypothetical protein [Acidimicrobiales bacterium]
MAPRGNSGRSVSPADARAYLAKATSWLDAAVENLDAGRWDVAAGSAVTAGINACDAISGTLLGRRAGGDHAGAVALLEGAGEDGQAASRQLAQLLRYKAPAQYDPAPMSAADARKAVELARRLTDRAGVTVGRRPGNQPGARG